MYADDLLKQNLMSEKDILLREIHSLYAGLDEKYGLQGASLPVFLDFDAKSLGAYISDAEGEHFRFSLLYIGYSLPHPLIREDRTDLFLHEYAHYMQYHISIPPKYQFNPGTHGSAWKYCCSLIGAVPTEGYRAGESLLEQDYEKHLENAWTKKEDENIKRHREAQENAARRASRVRFAVGDRVQHPKYGTGIVEAVLPQEGAVRLQVRFGEEQKTLDQMWLFNYMQKIKKGG